MDVRVLVMWERVADRERRERMKEGMYAVRVGMNASGAEYAQIMRDISDERTKEEKAKDVWEELAFVGGG